MMLPLLPLLLLLEYYLLREAVESVLGVVVVNKCLRDVAVDPVLIWVGQAQAYGSTQIWVFARAPVWVRVQSGTVLELKSGRALAKAVQSAFGNVLLHDAGEVVSHSVGERRPVVRYHHCPEQEQQQQCHHACVRHSCTLLPCPLIAIPTLWEDLNNAH